MRLALKKPGSISGYWVSLAQCFIQNSELSSVRFRKLRMKKRLSGHTRKDADDYLLLMMIALLYVSDWPHFYRRKHYKSLRRHSLTLLPSYKEGCVLKEFYCSSNPFL